VKARPALEFRLLGPLEIWQGDERLDLGAPKQRTLLALLLIRRGTVMSTDRLIDELWGERPPQTAAKGVQVYVSGLRKALGAGVLETRGRGYVLELDRGQVDADGFEDLLAQGSRQLAEGDPGEAAKTLREALALWRGPPLADFTYEDFAQEEIDRLEELRLTALEERIDADLALGRHTDLVAELTGLVGEYPLRERIRAQLMLALYRSGRQAEALEAYQAGRSALLEQRGLEPGPALRELEAAILRQEPELGAGARPAAPLLLRRRRGVLLMTAGGGAVLAAALVAGIIALTDGGGEEPTQSRGATPLPASTCSPIASTPGADPRSLLAADLPLGGDFRSLGAEMDAAIRYVLRQRRFQAGRYSIGYQACDESAGERGVDDQGRCEGNARAYARNERVIAVIGPFSSTCATYQIPITNRAGLAMLSPTNTYVGLTRAGPGTEPGEPDRLYPTGRRTYARVIPDDSLQAAANGLLARRLGIRRLFLLQGLAGASPGAMLDGVDYAATRVGVRIVGREAWDSTAQDFRELAERVRRSRPDGVFLGGALVENEGTLIRQLRSALPRARLLAPDGFSATDALVDAAGSAADGMTVTIAGTSPGALGSHGRAFVEGLSDHLGLTPEPYSIYAAQAAEVMLDAIERSDGTRASVVRELFRTRVRDGIVGDFSLTPAGDTTARAISVYRIEGGRQELFRVLTPPRDLVPGSTSGR
jgi:DNA-binding SARP family transcriptional activator/ABC-type branched-subunit amino acid transport system substrate-binding protein